MLTSIWKGVFTKKLPNRIQEIARRKLWMLDASPFCAARRAFDPSHGRDHSKLASNTKFLTLLDYDMNQRIIFT